MHTPSKPVDGFSMVELLVVVVILGILAAIALINTLNQRQVARDAQVASDLRALAPVQVGIFSETGQFTSDVANLGDWQPSPGTRACALEIDGGEQISIAAWHDSGSQTFTWTSTTQLVGTVNLPAPADCEEALAGSDAIS